jgi:hypothetical protein
MKQDSQIQVRGRSDPVQDPHRSLHSETGSLPGEHPGRSGNPLVKAAGLAWLEFEKPDLDRAEKFGTDVGITVADRTPDTLLLRGRWASTASLVVRRDHRDDRLARLEPRPRHAAQHRCREAVVSANVPPNCRSRPTSCCWTPPSAATRERRCHHER